MSKTMKKKDKSFRKRKGSMKKKDKSFRKRKGSMKKKLNVKKLNNYNYNKSYNQIDNNFEQTMTRQKHPLAQTTYEELINMMNYDNEIEKQIRFALETHTEISSNVGDPPLS